MRRAMFALLLLATSACARGGDPPVASATSRAATTTTTERIDEDAPVLYAAGDIADCNATADTATADLLDDLPGPVATLGDNAYQSGTAAQFAQCYGPTWGRFKDRTHPVAGNHDYETPGAAGYYDYFGTAAGRRGEGWYGYDVGAWHVVALNSNCGAVGCGRDSPQGRWLQADLAAHPTACTLAYWHHPRFSSGLHGSSEAMAELYAILYDAGAELVLAGHDHHYERIAPLDPGGRVDQARGIRNFVVGTGGKTLYPTVYVVPGSERRQVASYGVLELRLSPTGYGWRFLRAAGQPFTDSGTGRCH